MLQRIKSLFRSLAIYGLGDAATSIVSLLLLPVFTWYLDPADYGVIALLLVIEAVTKVVFRWGVDTAFMRLYYDCADQAARQRLASTLVFFLAAVNGTLLVAGIAAARWLSDWQFDTPEYGILVGLVMANMFVTGFYFIPLQVLRIRDESKQFIALSFARSAGTLVMRLVLVVGAGMGVMGVVVADVIVTAVFTAVLIPWFAPLIRPVFSPAILRDALAFGLPRIPHSIAHHVMGLADRYLLKWFGGTLADVGLYSMGATFGLALKFFLSAFEFAWTPFFLGVMREPDAKRIYSAVSTYVVAVLVLLVAVVSVVAPDLLRVATTPEFHGAAVVTPWIALGVMFQGLYLIGSIGLIITKRTTKYPLATGFAALVSLLANVLLIPRYGLLGAAWANAIAYATLAAVTVGFSWRLYPIPYEWSRLLRIAAAAALAYWVASVLPSSLRPVVGILLRGTVTVAVYGAALFITGFFHAGELKVLKDIRGRALARQTLPVTDTHQVEMAGEIVGTAPEPDSDPLSQDSPASRR